MALVKLASERRTQTDTATNPRSPGKHSVVPQLLEQEAFLGVLHREQRRTERSGRPFLLVLIGGAEPENNGEEFPSRKVAVAISSCSREIDFLGWYDEPNTLGILLTEFGEVTSEVIERIVSRICLGLQKSVSPETYCRLTLTVRVFPNDAEDEVFTMDPSRANIGGRIDTAMKRAIDIVGSLIAIIALSPVFLLIALLVKCTSKGTVLFRKQRLGRYGKEFSFYKFRTMYANNDPDIHREYVTKLIAGADVKQDNGLYKLTNDPRITPVGRFLRRTSLDELPQFFNVLLNDMSLVGPRPPLPYEYERYSAWHKRRVLELKPGITGLWQVEGRSRTTFDEMVRMDLRYARTRNLWVDFKIMLRTPSAMMSGQGAC